MEEPGVHHRMAAVKLLPGGIGDRDEPAGAAVQHRAGRGHGDRVRYFAGVAALAAGRRQGHPIQHAPGDGECARQAGTPRDGGAAGGPDAADVDRGRRGRQGIPAPGEDRPWVRSASNHVRAHPDP